MAGHKLPRGAAFALVVTLMYAASFVITPSAMAQNQRVVGDTLQLAQARQCERRAGPFVTQDTAWRRWREARAQGRSVSQGVVPCRDQYGTRGYCFFVFHAC